MTAPPPPPGPDGRPRTVDGAFYCWMAGATVAAAIGLMMVTVRGSIFVFAGILLIVVGLALGFLAGRARKRDPRFARAALALAMTAVAFLALVVLFLVPGIVVVALIAVAILALIAGSALNQRPASQAWYDAEAGT